MSQDANKELLPCPFCGGEAELWDGLGTQASVGCEECGIMHEIQVSDTFTYEERYNDPDFQWNEKEICYGIKGIERVNSELIEFWNTRTRPQAQVSGEVDEFKDDTGEVWSIKELKEMAEPYRKKLTAEFSATPEFRYGYLCGRIELLGFFANQINPPATQSVKQVKDDVSVEELGNYLQENVELILDTSTRTEDTLGTVIISNPQSLIEGVIEHLIKLSEGK